MSPREGALLGVSGRLKRIVKHWIWGIGKGRAVQKRVGGLILTICIPRGLRCVLSHKELPFEGRNDCTCVKIFSGVNILIAIISLAS